MDRVWRSAPVAALHVRMAAEGLQLAPNEAALRWGARHGVHHGDWQTLAGSRMPPLLPDASRLSLGSPPQAVDCLRVALAEGEWLFWLVPLQPGGREGAEALAEPSRLIAEAIGVGFWSRDLDSGTAHWDEQMHRIHRRPLEAGAPGFEEWIELYVHPEDRSRIAELRRLATARWLPVVDASFRAPDENGQSRWVQTWTRRLRRDGRRLAFGMHLDVTDRERTRALQERERARTQVAVEAGEVGIWERSLDGRRVYWNETMYRLRGLDPADPRPIAELGNATAHPEDLLALDGLVRRHLEDGTPYRYEFRVRAANGGWRWLGTRGSALRSGNGQLLGMAGINVDITDRKVADALRQQTERAEQASRDKSAFLARVSHELRTPMNAVLGFTQLMADDPLAPPSAAQRARLQHIADAGSQMMGLIDELLELAQAGSGHSAARPLPPTHAEARALRVLCVEDNPVNLLLVRELLAQRPAVQLQEATDGRSGIAVARAELPDVILLDLHLPDIPGLQVLQQLRTEAALAGCRFVALSADAMPDHIAHARAAGFDDYWTKPIDFEQFLAGIDRLAAEIQGASRSSSQAPVSSNR